MKSFMLRKEDVNRVWHHVDASGKVLGRLASAVAIRLMGKHKPTYTFHTDDGDYVVVTNAALVALTGKKLDRKLYYRHSGKPGNMKETKMKVLMDTKPERVFELAVKRMLPKNKIGTHMLTRLRIFADDKHSHEAQKPVALNI